MYQKMTALNTSFSNWLITYPDLKKASSKHYSLFSNERLPSSVVNQTIRDVVTKVKQGVKRYRVNWCLFNNQNSKLQWENGLYKISFPTLEKRIGVPLIVKDYHRIYLDQLLHGEAKLGTTMLHRKKKRWFVTIAITLKTERKTPAKEKTMGIDLGLRNLAVTSVGTKSEFFKGNHVGFIRRRYASLRKKLGKAKKLAAIKKQKNKEARWMKAQNHAISRRIIRSAVENGVSTIRMEDLTGIRMTAKSRREAGRNVNSWGFRQLHGYIQYKAEMAGITVQYVKPEYTSQTCPCGHREKGNRCRDVFRCKQCGYTSHADHNAAMNISKAISGMKKKLTRPVVTAGPPDSVHHP